MVWCGVGVGDVEVGSRRSRECGVGEERSEELSSSLN